MYHTHARLVEACLLYLVVFQGLAIFVIIRLFTGISLTSLFVPSLHTSFSDLLQC